MVAAGPYSRARQPGKWSPYSKVILLGVLSRTGPGSPFLLPVHVADDRLVGKCRMVNRHRADRERVPVEREISNLFGTHPARIPRSVHLGDELVAVDGLITNDKFCCVR